MGIGASTTLLMGELASDSRRGRINFIYGLQYSLRALTIYILGSFIGWEAQSFACACFSLSYLVLLLTFVPDTPRHLIKNEQYEKAMKTVEYIRDSKNVRTEYEQVSSYQLY